MKVYRVVGQGPIGEILSNLDGIRNIRSQDYSFPWWTFRSLDHSFPGISVPRNECFMEHSFPRTNRPWNIRSLDVLELGNFFFFYRKEKLLSKIANYVLRINVRVIGLDLRYQHK